MRFQVTRTSQRMEQSPCEGAQSEIHTFPNGYQVTVWFIDLAGMNDLFAFLQREGKCVISAMTECSPTWAGPSIEIYDTWRE